MGEAMYRITIGVAIPLLLSALGLCSLGVTPATTQPTSKPAAPADLNKLMWDCWNDLEKSEPWPTRAALDLYDHPQQAVLFLHDRLQPLKISSAQLDAAINDLGNRDEKIWRPAFEKLEYLDPRLNKTSVELLANLNLSVARSRLVALMTSSSPEQWIDYDISCEPGGTPGWTTLRFSKDGKDVCTETIAERVSDISLYKPQWIRVDHAVVLLQHIGTPDAIAILRDLATGQPGAQPTKVAKIALESVGETVNQPCQKPPGSCP